MKLPKGKGKPRLPPPPPGGDAAARQRQSEMERGLPPPSFEGGEGDCPPGGEGPAKKDDKTGKKKK